MEYGMEIDVLGGNTVNVNVVIDEPLCKLEHLYRDEEIHLFTKERFLPKILVEIGFFRSDSEVKRNRPDLAVELRELDFLHIRVGKKHLWLTVGE